MIVPNRLTPLQAAEAGRALFAAYAQLTGAPPSDSVGALLLAQSALETGNWQKIHNFNFGNIKARTDYPLIVQFRCSEVANGVEQFYDPPDPHCNFRAYATATEGAADYLKVLHDRSHWWQGLQSGDPSVFVDALATPPKYFTANPEGYKRTLTALYRQFLPLGSAILRSRSPTVPVPAAPVATSGSGSLLPLPPSASTSAPSAHAVELTEPATPVPVALSDVKPSEPADTTTRVLAGAEDAARAVTFAAEAVRDAAVEARANSTTSPVQPPPPRRPPPPPLARGAVPGAPAGGVNSQDVPRTPGQGAIDVALDTANAIAVVADAAEALVAVGGTNGVPAVPGPAAKAATVVRVVRWAAQMLAWVLAAIRSALAKPGAKAP